MGILGWRNKECQRPRRKEWFEGIKWPVWRSIVGDRESDMVKMGRMLQEQ